MKKKAAKKNPAPRRRSRSAKLSALTTPAMQGNLRGPRITEAAPARRGTRRTVTPALAAGKAPAPKRSGTSVPPAGGAEGSPAPQGAPGGNIATAAQVDAFIRQSLAGKLDASNIIRLGDANFYVPTLAELRAVIARSQGHRKQYTAERFDCDDFAYVLKGEFSSHFYASASLVCGFAAGIIWGRFSWIAEFHSANFGITSDHGFVLIEPQSGDQPDKLFPVSACQGGVSLILV